VHPVSSWSHIIYLYVEKEPMNSMNIYRCAELFRQIIMIQCMIHQQPDAFPPVVVICRARSALSRFLVASAVVDLSPGEQGTGTLSVD
jgi:hypothetical protein